MRLEPSEELWHDRTIRYSGDGLLCPRGHLCVSRLKGATDALLILGIIVLYALFAVGIAYKGTVI